MRPVQGQKALDADMAGTGNQDEAAMEHRRLVEAIGAAGDVAYAWDVRSGSLDFLGPVPDTLGAQFASLRTADGFAARIFPEDATLRAEALARHLSGAGAYECEYRIRDDHDDPVWVHDRGIARRDAAGQPLSIAGVLRLTGARKAREAQLEYLANHDELTGHYNRARLKDSLEQALGFARRYGVPGAYMVIGIDKLGPINDAFGHEAADAVIVAVGRLLDRTLRNTDVIGRLGGDRFGVVLSHCPVAVRSATADKILSAVRQARIETPSAELHVTASIGGVAFHEHPPMVSEVMSRGDTALHQAKQQGRNCFALHQDSPAHREQRRHVVWMVEEVQAGLKDGRVLLAFQPVVDAMSHAVDHYECLIRLRRRNGQYVPAASFIPFVEQSGLMRQVDRRALELAIEELSAHPTLRLAVNVSGHTTSDRSWLRMLNALVRGMPEMAERLTVEITETVALEDIDETARFVRSLRDLGCRVALDDFGAGYTSFRNLKALAVDCVKIDGSYVRGLEDNVDNQLFVRTLLGLAEGLGLVTVAECVETAPEAALLTRRGVRFLQGWHFGKPEIDRPWLVAPAVVPVQAAPPQAAVAGHSPASRLTVLKGGLAGG